MQHANRLASRFAIHIGPFGGGSIKICNRKIINHRLFGGAGSGFLSKFKGSETNEVLPWLAPSENILNI
jgi:hypothetical protein